MNNPHSGLLNTDEQPIDTADDRSFWGFMQRYWPIIMCAAGVIVSFSVLQQRTNDNDRRIDRLESTQATKDEMILLRSELRDVRDDVKYLVRQSKQGGPL